MYTTINIAQSITLIDLITSFASPIEVAHEHERSLLRASMFHPVGHRLTKMMGLEQHRKDETVSETCTLDIFRHNASRQAEQLRQFFKHVCSNTNALLGYIILVHK